MEPVAPLEALMKGLETEAKDKGYTREDWERDIDRVREWLMAELYGRVMRVRKP